MAEKRERLQVAIADDDASVLAATVSLVRALGHDAIGFSGAEELLKYIEQSPCHIVVTDYNMPGMNGLELLERIRADQRLKDIQVVVQSGDNIKAEVEGKDALFVGKGSLGLSMFDALESIGKGKGHA